MPFIDHLICMSFLLVQTFQLHPHPREKAQQMVVGRVSGCANFVCSTSESLSSAKELFVT